MSSPRNYRQATRQAQQPTAWEAEIANLKARVHALANRMAGVEGLQGDLKDLETEIYATPLHGFYAGFALTCGSKGLLAIHLRCTKCRKEGWWGHYPKK